jgi:predicted O-methyltransferase YrrM
VRNAAVAGALPRPRALAAPVPKILQSLDKRRYAPWFWRKEFSSDWVSRKISVWCRVLGPWRNHPIRIVEIGSWEGRSALFFLRFFPHACITCIDTFAGGADQVDNPECATEVPETEGRFDRNLARYAARVEKIKSRSVPALEALAAAGRQFELAYIDGSHLSADVMDDTLRTWPLVVPGGVVIWDDYDWGRDRPLAERPQPAVDKFLAARTDRARLLARGSQMIVERLG